MACSSFTCCCLNWPPSSTSHILGWSKCAVTLSLTTSIVWESEWILTWDDLLSSQDSDSTPQISYKPVLQVQACFFWLVENLSSSSDSFWKPVWHLRDKPRFTLAPSCFDWFWPNFIRMTTDHDHACTCHMTLTCIWPLMWFNCQKYLLLYDKVDFHQTIFRRITDLCFIYGAQG